MVEDGNLRDLMYLSGSSNDSPLGRCQAEMLSRAMTLIARRA